MPWWKDRDGREPTGHASREQERQTMATRAQGQPLHSLSTQRLVLLERMCRIASRR